MLDITNIKFDLVDSTKPKFVEVVATYECNHKCFHHCMFVERKRNYSKADYLKEAEIIFANDRARNKINIGKMPKRNRFLITASCIFAAITLAVGGFLAYKAINSMINSYNPGASVEVKTDIADLPEGYEVKLSNLEAKVNEKYETKITLSNKSTNGDIHYRLPSVLDKVTSYQTDLTQSQYTYTYESETETSLLVEGKYVFGPIVIKLTLVEVPGPTPVTGHKILLSERSVGVSLSAGQTISEDEVSSFDVKININEGYQEPIKVRYIAIGKKQYEYPNDYSVICETESYHITFNKPCTIDNDVTLTISAQEVITGIRKISMSPDFNLYKDEACKTLYTSQELSAIDVSKNFVGYIKPETVPETGTYLSLGVDVSKGESVNPLIFNEDYKYRFITDDVAEITIPSGKEDMTITPKLTQAKAEFIYHAKPGVEGILTLCFNNGEEQNNTAAIIDWGDDSTPEPFDNFDGGSFYHIYHNNETIDKDYLISILPFEETSDPIPEVPQQIGFYTGNYDTVYDEEPTRFASGLKNIKGAHLTEHFTDLIASGFNYTNIDSLYISNNLKVYYDSYFCNFMFCNNLEAFYVNPDNENYSTNSNHTMLLCDNGMNVITIANIEKVIFDTSITTLSAGACVGRNRVTSLSFSRNFKSILCDYPDIPAIANCPNLKSISVNRTNTTFIGDKGNIPVNALIKIDKNNSNGVRYTFYTTISNTPIELLNESDELCIMPFAFSSSNSYAGDILINRPKKVTFAYSSFYDSPVTSITLVGNVFEINTLETSGMLFYRCHNLKSVIFDSFLLNEDVNYSQGLIQKCPNLTKLDITTYPIAELTDKAVYAVNNTLYQYINGAGMNLIATSSVTEVLEEVDIAGSIQPVVNFADNVFNGNNLKEIYIPNNLSNIRNLGLGAGVTAPLKVSDESPYYKVDDSIPGQSLLYGPIIDPESGEPVEVLYGVSLAENNHTLIITDKINWIVTGVVSYYDYLYEIKFTANDASQYYLTTLAFYSCNNLTTVDFTASTTGKAPEIGILNGTEVFMVSPYQMFVTIKVASNAYPIFIQENYPLSVYNVIFG